MNFLLVRKAVAITGMRRGVIETAARLKDPGLDLDKEVLHGNLDNEVQVDLESKARIELDNEVQVDLDSKARRGLDKEVQEDNNTKARRELADLFRGDHTV